MAYENLEEIYDIVLGAESLQNGATHEDLVHRLLILKEKTATQEKWKPQANYKINGLGGNVYD